MNDTVKRLMCMCDELAYAKAELTRHEYETWHMGSEVAADVRAFEEQRQALQDELTRLFTPLTDEQIDDACESLGFGALSWTVVARAVETAHGITGESK